MGYIREKIKELRGWSLKIFHQGKHWKKVSISGQT
jgi:hypothetical protein